MMNKNGNGSDDPQRQDYKKSTQTGEKPSKQVASEVLPNRMSRATITGGDMMNRFMNNYSKRGS